MAYNYEEKVKLPEEPWIVSHPVITGMFLLIFLVVLAILR